MRKKINEVGNRYERLTVIAEAKTVSGNAMWLCRCDCGNMATVLGFQLRRGHTKSCGCLRIDEGSKRLGINNPNYIGGTRCGWSKKQHEFKESIRKRDNYICQDCGKTQEQELIDEKRKLSVHHKDGNHFNNVPENATTLCASCHGRLEREIYSLKRDAEIQWAVYEMNKETNDEC